MFKIKIQDKTFYTEKERGASYTVLKNINLTINEGEFVSLIGPSGCGKTTLLRIIAGFDKDFNGTLKIRNKKTGNYENFESLGRVGYIPQQFSLFPWKTIEENIRFGLKIRKVPRSEQDQIVDKLLELVKMKEFRTYYPKEISGGMNQKIAICRALAIRPISNLILMDEPFSALDAQTRNRIQEDLLDIWEKMKLTIIFVTHNIDEAIFLSDRIIVLGDHPTTIIKRMDISLPRPRERTSTEFNRIRKELLELLQEEQKKKKDH